MKDNTEMLGKDQYWLSPSDITKMLNGECVKKGWIYVSFRMGNSGEPTALMFRGDKNDTGKKRSIILWFNKAVPKEIYASFPYRDGFGNYGVMRTQESL